MAQMENLVGYVLKPPTNDAPCKRHSLFYCVRPQPIWAVQKDLAYICVSLGAVSSALQIYERLELWEDAVICMIRSGRGSDALDLVKRQLEIKETPFLWCLYGDILQEPEHYLKAWELSRHSCAKAMSSLGAYYASKKRFEDSVDCFNKSLKVLPLQIGTWFTL